MRVTLEIDDEVLSAAEEVGARTNRTAGQVISECARLGLAACRSGVAAEVRNGFAVIPANGRVVTSEMVRRFAEEADLP